MLRTNCTEFDFLIASLLILNWLIETWLISMLINLCVDAYFLYFIAFYYRLIEYRMAMVDTDCAGLLNHCTIYLLISPWIVLLWCYSCEAYIQNNSLGKKEIEFFLKNLTEILYIADKKIQVQMHLKCDINWFVFTVIEQCSRWSI